MTMSEPRRPLEELAANPSAIIVVNHNFVTRSEPIFDEDIIALGRAADVPSPMCRHRRPYPPRAETGRLIVMEKNPKDRFGTSPRALGALSAARASASACTRSSMRWSEPRTS